MIEHTVSEQHRALFALLLTSGLRIGEALGLTRSDLDEKHMLIRVEFQLGRDGVRAPLKTEESRRSIDVPAHVMNQLVSLHDCRASMVGEERLVFSGRTGRALERKVVREALRRASRAAEFAEPYPSVHDLRHSHASMLIALGLSVVEVQRRLGHCSPETTLRVYAHQWHYGETQRTEIGPRIGRLFEGETADRPTP